MNIINQIEKNEIKKYPKIHPGDTISIGFKIKEGDKERIQKFKGVCISIKNQKNRPSIRVRRTSLNYGVEKIFPLSSPKISNIKIIQSGKVRRAKLYYLRSLKGKKARIKRK
jgi:large subunit ribosomal protein L19